jgi:hypothetical protein
MAVAATSAAAIPNRTIRAGRRNLVLLIPYSQNQPGGAPFGGAARFAVGVQLQALGSVHGRLPPSSPSPSPARRKVEQSDNVEIIQSEALGDIDVNGLPDRQLTCGLHNQPETEWQPELVY